MSPRPYDRRMSHFTTVRTQMVEADYLLAALKDLGYTPEQAGPIRGFAGSSTAGEFKITTGSRGYDIGFRNSGDRYEIVADWWGIRDVNQDDFVRRLTQRYAYHAARAKLDLCVLTALKTGQRQLVHAEGPEVVGPLLAATADAEPDVARAPGSAGESSARRRP